MHLGSATRRRRRHLGELCANFVINKLNLLLGEFLRSLITNTAFQRAWGAPGGRLRPGGYVVKGKFTQLSLKCVQICYWGVFLAAEHEYNVQKDLGAPGGATPWWRRRVVYRVLTQLSG